jgi:ubiquinone/menaquinone biosynthesis C-methylase UbiE
MSIQQKDSAEWGSSYRLVAAEKWKAKSAAMGRAVTEALVEYASPQPGMHVLDVASGTGEPAISLADRVGREGRVIALDLSSDLLEIAAKRAQQRGFENLYLHQGDAQALPFADSIFDLATSRFGVMFFSDIQKALRELHRVLRPGARACFTAWGPFEQPYWQSTIGVVARRLGGPIIAEGHDPFRFGEPGSLSSEMKRAGFVELEEQTRSLPWPWPGPPEEMWEQVQAVAAPFRPLLSRVPKDLWPSVTAEVMREVGKFADERGVHFEAVVVMASGVKR